MNKLHLISLAALGAMAFASCNPSTVPGAETAEDKELKAAVE